MSNAIKNSFNSDVRADLIEDIIPERLIRVYPYELVNASKSEAFVKANTVTIASISQGNLDSTNELLKTDEKGHKYFEIVAGITSNGALDFNSGTDTIGQELKEEDSFTCLSNWFYEGELSNIQIGNLRFMPAVFFVGKSYNQSEYEAGEQTSFLSTGMMEAREGQVAYSNEIDPEGLYEFRLINMTSVESSLNNVVVRYEPSDITLDNPTITYSGKDYSGFEIKTDPEMLIHSVKVKGKTSVNSKLTDIDVTVLEGLAPLKSTPVSTTGKLSMFMDWFDYDVAMPQYIANVFQQTNGVKLSELKNIDFEKDGNTVPFFNDDQLHLVQDVILVSALFASSFSEPSYRYTADEAKNAGGGAKAGDIKGELFVTSNKLSMAAMAGKDPIKVIDGIFETYLRKFPDDEDSTQYLAIKEIFASASRYIYSSYAIGKGQNSFNQIYLPWYLKPLSKIEVQSPNSDNVILLSDETLWRLESKWFDFSNRKFDLIKDVPISNVKLIKTDRKLTMPEVPNNITAINKLPLPGDINTKSSTDLQYIWYMPISDQDSLSKLYLGTPQSTTSAKPTITFNTDWTRYGESISDTQAYIINSYIRLNGGSASNYHYVSSGSLEERIQRTNSVPKKLDIHNFDREFPNGVGSWPDKAIDTTGSYYSPGNTIGVGGISGSFFLPDKKPITEDEFKTYLRQAIVDYNQLIGNTWMDLSNVKIVDVTGFKNWTYSGDHWAAAASWGVEFVSNRYAGAKITADSPQTSYDIDREVLFDKDKWIKYLSRNHIQSAGNLTLVESNDESITKIDEIILSSIWGEQVVVSINGVSHTIPLFNKDDETIGIQRILFS